MRNKISRLLFDLDVTREESIEQELRYAVMANDEPRMIHWLGVLAERVNNVQAEYMKQLSYRLDI